MVPLWHRSQEPYLVPTCIFMNKNINATKQINSLDPNLWISHDWKYRYASVGHRYIKKGMGVDQKSSQYLVWPPFTSCSATHLLHIELIRLLIVACGMLSQFSSMAVLNCWILAGTGTCCHTCWSRATKHAQWVTCLVSMQAMEELGHLASRNCVQVLVTVY